MLGELIGVVHLYLIQLKPALLSRVPIQYKVEYKRKHMFFYMYKRLSEYQNF